VRASSAPVEIRRKAAEDNVLSWAFSNAGDVGRRGADVGALAAWTITRGVADIRVAILGEGLESKHPALAGAVSAERDFIAGHKDARPDGDDAYDTSLAGLVASRSSTHPGPAPGASLIAARIAVSDATGAWVFDDYGHIGIAAGVDIRARRFAANAARRREHAGNVHEACFIAPDEAREVSHPPLACRRRMALGLGTRLRR
jgi:subtilisin family serine protease